MAKDESVEEPTETAATGAEPKGNEDVRAEGPAAAAAPDAESEGKEPEKPPPVHVKGENIITPGVFYTKTYDEKCGHDEFWNNFVLPREAELGWYVLDIIQGQQRNSTIHTVQYVVRRPWAKVEYSGTEKYDIEAKEVLNFPREDLDTNSLIYTANPMWKSSTKAMTKGSVARKLSFVNVNAQRV